MRNADAAGYYNKVAVITTSLGAFYPTGESEIANMEASRGLQYGPDGVRPSGPTSGG